MARKPRSDIRPMPEGFPRHAHLPSSTLRAMYRAGPESVRRWLAECGAHRKRGEMQKGRVAASRRAKPQDFDETYVRLGWEATRVHYRTGALTMTRWVDEAGPEVRARALAREKAPSPPGTGAKIAASLRLTHQRRREAEAKARAEAARLAAMTPWERQLERAKRVGIIERPRLVANDREYSLTGCGLAL